VAPSVPDDALTLSEIAQRLRVDSSTVRMWVKTGRLRAQKAGPSSHSHWWVRPDDLERMLAQRGRSAASPDAQPLETDYVPGPDEPGLGMLSSIDFGFADEEDR
jgi:excisionase family DNA binding protein